METRFADRLGLVMKVLALSRGQLAVALAVDKSLVSRWLTGSTEPGNHNLARLTAYVAERTPGFTMLDWEAGLPALRRRLGLPDEPTALVPATRGNGHDPGLLLPDFARLPAFTPARHETAALGRRYLGLWRLLVPSSVRPRELHWEHLLLEIAGDWLIGRAIGYCYEWPAAGCIVNGQLVLWLSDANDFVFRLFARANGPIVDRVDGLILAVASSPGQPPTAFRFVAEHLADTTEAEAELEARAAERRIVAHDEVAPDLLAAVLSPCDHLRAGLTPGMIVTRWY